MSKEKTNHPDTTEENEQTLAAQSIRRKLFPSQNDDNLIDETLQHLREEEKLRERQFEERFEIIEELGTKRIPPSKFFRIQRNNEEEEVEKSDVATPAGEKKGAHEKDSPG